MSIDHLTTLTKNFISDNIKDQDPDGLCYSTSISLQIYLAIKGINTLIIKGQVTQN